MGAEARQEGAAVSDETVTLDLPNEFGAADNAVVMIYSEPQFTISDPDVVQTFVAALAPLAEGWGVPPGGVPITRVRVDLRSGDRGIGNIGIGVDSLTAHVHGGFLARSSSESIATALLAVLGKEWLLQGDAPLLEAPPAD